MRSVVEPPGLTLNKLELPQGVGKVFDGYGAGDMPVMAR
jgi:hypothetical protein